MHDIFVENSQLHGDSDEETAPPAMKRKRPCKQNA
jgi:hypothetical protein